MSRAIAILLLAGACRSPIDTVAGDADGAPRPDATGAPDAPDVPDAPPPPLPRDVTFYVVADTHADPPESYDLRALARAIDAVADDGTWPATIDGAPTGFTEDAIAPPRGVVFLGDITGWGTAPAEIPTFRRYFAGGAETIAYPAYVGLGNHDLDDADRPPELGQEYRDQFWAFVESRHRGAAAPVPVTRFDDASRAYSWDLDDVHLVQTHRYPGDDHYGLTSSLDFLRDDLDVAAGRPVFVFHHYGMDAFGTQDRWWTGDERAAYRDVLRDHDVAAIFTGHSHAAFHYEWEDLRVFQVNNAKAENGTGNNDGNGSFAIVRITDERLDMVTCRWLDDTGRYELVAPYYSGPASTGGVP